MGIYIDTDLDKSTIVLLICLFTGLWVIYLPVLGIVKLVKYIHSSSVEHRLNSKKKKFEKELQEYIQDYEDGALTEDELDDIVQDYNSRDGRISVSLTKRQPEDE